MWIGFLFLGVALGACKCPPSKARKEHELKVAILLKIGGVRIINATVGWLGTTLHKLPDLSMFSVKTLRAMINLNEKFKLKK
jgi:hypothetical protein